MKKSVSIIGGGLAGCEAANVLARHGIPVDLYEMRPHTPTPAHKTDQLGELVCSNSLRSSSVVNAVGLLKWEMAQLQSLVIDTAIACRVPAGDALAVDRELFAQRITQHMESQPLIRIHRQEVTDLSALLKKGPVIVATGPLTSPALAEALKPYVGEKQLYFYDAIAPIIDAASIDQEKIFAASRYQKGGGDDYINCPFNEEEYYNFVRQLRNGQRVLPKAFEKEIYFEGCLPVEVMADRGDLTLAFGPMKPVGLVDPRTGRTPFAVVQLRSENRDNTAYNMVGFQTKLTYAEQKRVFQMIPGLENADFFRLGSIHRNTYINSTCLLNSTFQLKSTPGLRFAGQVTGTEGYVESSALGILVGLLTAREVLGETLNLPPRSTALGAMAHYLTDEEKVDFQPMNINFGIFEAVPKTGKKMKKEDRKNILTQRARDDFAAWMQVSGLHPPQLDPAKEVFFTAPEQNGTV